MWKPLFLLYLVTAVYADDEDSKVVKSRNGPVKGRKDPVGVYVFKNIPYATTPKGAYKFSEAFPPPAWLQPLEASEKSIICPQPPHSFIDFSSTTMQENCLVANVYSPVTEEKNLPVLVYIHGGGFEIGFGDMLTPKNFVKENNIIVVTFNYRLGVHGFLCLGTQAVPGNTGLKDQVALLRWVQKNIEAFGGNPKDVTIAGGSAGSISTDLLMLSKTTQGLFNKIILESGASVGSIGVQLDPLENAKEFAHSLNFNNVNDIYALEDFYKNSPLESIVKSTFDNRKDASLLFAPCIERNINSAFITDSPLNIITKGAYKKLPMLVGFSNMEGLIYIQKFEEWKNEMNENFSKFLPADLKFEDPVQKDEVTNRIKEFYFGDKLVSEETILSYIDYFSDVLFGYPTYKTVRLHVENGHNDVYLYEYSFTDNDTTPVPHTEVRGATHCAQTMAIFDTPTPDGESTLSEEHKTMKATIRKLWGNFIKQGKPVPDGSPLPSWPPVTTEKSSYMSLGKKLELRSSLLESRGRFWDVLYQNLYRQPVPPPAPAHTEL